MVASALEKALLPPPTTTHWGFTRKALVVDAVRKGLITKEEAIQRYSLSDEEFKGWERAVDAKRRLTQPQNKARLASCQVYEINFDNWSLCCGDTSWDALLGKVDGMPCFGALDLCKDRACWGKLFCNENGFVWVPQFYVSNVSLYAGIYAVDYKEREKQGAVTCMSGRVLDERHIQRDILNDARRFGITRIAHDLWGRHQVFDALKQSGLTLVRQSIGFQGMDQPLRYLLELIRLQKITHGSHPIMDWMIGNVEILNHGDEIRPGKRNPNSQIEGVVTLLMALALSASKTTQEADPTIFYDAEGRN